MQEVTKDYLKAVEGDSRYFSTRCTFSTGDIITDNEIRSGAYTNIIDGNSIVSMGNACSNKVEMTIGDFHRDLWKGAEFALEKGLEVNDATEWTPWGTFWVTDMSTANDGRTVSITAYDFMYKLGLLPYTTGLTAPFHYRDLLDEFLTKSGMTLSEESQAKLPERTDTDYTILSWPDGEFSYASIAGHLAGMVCSNARISLSDPTVLEFVWYTPTGTLIESTLYQDGFEKLADSELIVQTFKVTGDNKEKEIEIENTEESTEGELDFRPFDSVDPADHPWLTFTYNDETLTASVRLTEGYENDTAGFEIPYSLRVNGNYYSVTTIDEYGFKNCMAHKIILPKTLTTIYSYAFYGCVNITEITIPENVSSMRSEILGHCESLHTIYYNTDKYVRFSISSPFHLIRSKLGVVVIIGNTVKSVPEEAFKYAPDIVQVSIPESVTKIGESAFAHCDNLTSITIPNSVTSIGEYAFADCPSLTSVTIPESVITLGGFVFIRCTSLTKVNVKCNITILPRYTFYGCSALTDITLPKTIKTVDNDAFNGCTSLITITLPDSIVAIENLAFANCTALTYVQIGTSANCAISEIVTYAFKNCDALTNITIYAAVDSVSGAPWSATNATINWVG